MECGKKFSILVKERREALRISTNELSEATGVSTSYLWRLESGKNYKPSIDVVAAICKVLGLSLAELEQYENNDKEDFLESRLVHKILDCKSKKNIGTNDMLSIIRELSKFVEAKERKYIVGVSKSEAYIVDITDEFLMNDKIVKIHMERLGCENLMEVEGSIKATSRIYTLEEIKLLSDESREKIKNKNIM